MASVQLPVVYSYFRSGASWRLRIALALKKIDYEMRTVNLLKKEQLEQEYLQINAMGQVPAFVIDGNVLTQSMAILEYLEEVYPEKPLIPRDPLQRHKVREICEIVGSGIQPLQNLSVLLKCSDDAEKRAEWSKFWIEKGFLALESILANSSGKYCVGDELSWADIFLVPQVAAANRFQVNMTSYPTISKIHEALEKLEPFKIADPFVQPDCPPDLRK